MGAGEAEEPVACAEVDGWDARSLFPQLRNDDSVPSILGVEGGSHGLLQGSGYLGWILVTAPEQTRQGQCGLVAFYTAHQVPRYLIQCYSGYIGGEANSSFVCLIRGSLYVAQAAPELTT